MAKTFMIIEFVMSHKTDHYIVVIVNLKKGRDVMFSIYLYTLFYHIILYHLLYSYIPSARDVSRNGMIGKGEVVAPKMRSRVLCTTS